jgi:hypothetical protein
MLVFELDPEHRVGQQFGHDAFEFEQFFLGHRPPFPFRGPRDGGGNGRKMAVLEACVKRPSYP